VSSTQSEPGLTIEQVDLQQEVPIVRAMIKTVALPELLVSLAQGPYGLDKPHLDLLNIIEQAGAVYMELEKALKNRIIQDRQGAGFGFANRLDPVDEAFCNLFAVYAAADSASAASATLSATSLEVKGSFKAPWVQRIRHASPRELLQTLVQELIGFLEHHRHHKDPDRRLSEPSQLVDCAGAFFTLLANSVQEQAVDSEFERHRRALEKIPTEVCGRCYHGFSPQISTAKEEEPAELLPVSPEDIVGNKEFLQAGLRLARDVAGFDLATGRNPKKLNPVLFGQGSPGCGKTVTAHAIGNYFLNYCRERHVPAKFLVIRRTDWASSFQNASATQLVKIFKEEVQAFRGVVGVYWPDIDTAFAARSDPGMRGEESNILGASFGIFDGTLIPKNGKWFLICDANYMNMDEATLSRISQDPHKILGPTTREDFVELMRDKKLKDFQDMLPLTDDEWLQLGEKCIQCEFSGRNVESICQKILTEIQDVEPPEEYYKVSFEERKEILKSLARPMTLQRIQEIMNQYAEFEQVAESQANDERFQTRVKEIVLNLSAQRAAMEITG